MCCLVHQPQVEGGELLCDEDGLRDIEQITIAWRCERMDRATHVLLAIPEYGAGGLDREFPCASASLVRSTCDVGVRQL